MAVANVIMTTTDSPPAEVRPQPLPRDAVLARLAAHVADPAAPPVILIEGPYGVGKTTVLDRLEASLPADVKPVRVGLDGYSSAPDAAESPLTEYRFFLDLLHTIAEGAGTPNTTTLAKAIDAEYEHARSRTDDAVLPDVGRWARKFVSGWNAETGDRRIVVLGDGASEALRESVGEWFLSFVAAKLSNTVIVLARTSGPSRVDPASVKVERLIGLSRADAAAAVADGIGATPSARLVDRIMLVTGGHPGALDAYLSAVRARGGGEDEFLRVVADPPAELRRTLDDIGRAMRQPLSDEAARHALEVGAVPRRLNESLLHTLIHGKRVGDDIEQTAMTEAAKLLTTLAQFGLVEVHEERGVEPYFAVHPFLRETINRELRQKRDLHTRLHALCEAEFWERMHRPSDRAAFEDPDGYAGAYRVEETQYIADAAECLYHLQHTQPDYAPLMLLLTYFDAFWWWGWYAESEACERLLRDEAFQTAPWAAKSLDTLRAFHERYPRGADPGGEWSSLHQPLTTLLAATDEDAAGTDLDKKRLRGILSAFLGQTHRFGTRDFAAARRWYEASKSSFLNAGSTEAWNVPWLDFYLADLERDLGDPGEAPAIAQRAIARAEQQKRPHNRDWELIANCYRVIGDVELPRNLSAAFAAYGRAALAAYVFQGAPKPPDPYTAAFYDEITGHVAQQLSALAERDPAGAARAADEIRRVWTAAGIGQLPEERPFPPGPAPADFDDRTSPYVIAVRQTLAAASETLSKVGASP